MEIMMINQKNYEVAAEIRETERKYIFNILVNYATAFIFKK